MLRAIFRVPRPSADQREIQKKDEYRFSISIKNNSARKSSHVNASEVGDVQVVELQSCAEFESKSHLT